MEAEALTVLREPRKEQVGVPSVCPLSDDIDRRRDCQCGQRASEHEGQRTNDSRLVSRNADGTEE